MALPILTRVLRKAIFAVSPPLTRITASHSELLVELLKNGKPGSRVSLPGNLLAKRDYNNLIIGIRKKISSPRLENVALKAEGVTEIKTLHLKLYSTIFAKEKIPLLAADLSLGLFDYDRLKFPLVIRTKKPGDKFIPLGMKGEKKLQDFFVDSKISRDERSRVLLLVSNDEIIWVIGKRIGERYKINQKTVRVFAVLVQELLK
jgi:tRNA(Ile)-lysidine synthase